MNRINAREIVGTGFPPEEGHTLARALLEVIKDWSALEVDVTALPAGLIISAFFNGFLQEVFAANPSLLDTARHIKWAAQFDFQQENITRWMQDFKPTMSATG